MLSRFEHEKFYNLGPVFMVLDHVMFGLFVFMLKVKVNNFSVMPG